MVIHLFQPTFFLQSALVIRIRPKKNKGKRFCMAKFVTIFSITSFMCNLASEQKKIFEIFVNKIHKLNLLIAITDHEFKNVVKRKILPSTESGLAHITVRFFTK